MTRYELATLSVTRSTGAAAAQTVPAFAAAGEGRLLGCWLPDIGALNTVVVLRGFADDAELARERARTLRSGNPFGCADRLAGLALDSYAPFPFLPPVETGSFGPVYEIRSYAMVAGGLEPVLAGWEAGLPFRTSVSKLLIAMYALDGPPRITHIWPYASSNDRSRLRAEALQPGHWPPQTGQWIAREMHSAIYLPTPGSPLQ